MLFRSSGRIVFRSALALAGFTFAHTSALAQRTPTRADTIPVRLEPLPFQALIGNPACFVGGASGFVFVDFSTMQSVRADNAGKWTDSLAARGAGPGEFRSVSGVAFETDGRIWVADRANGRLTQLSPELKVLSALSTSAPLRSFAPSAAGRRFIAIPESVQDLAIVVDSAGQLQRRVAFAAQEASLNPILRERTLIRVSDSLAIIQFRWLDRRIGLRMDGRVAYSVGDLSQMPKVVAMPMGPNTAYRIESGAAEFALSIAVHGDELLVLRGSANERAHGRTISAYDVKTGVLRRTLLLPRALLNIASNGPMLLGIAETEDGFGMYRLVLER